VKLLLLGGVAVCGVLLSAATRHPSPDKQSFHANLTGSAEVPPVMTAAQGTAEFTLTGDTMTYSITAQGLTGVEAAHLHLGVKGKNGAPAVTLYKGPKTDVASGELTHGSFTAVDLHGVTLQTLIGDMKKGAAYVNVHTSAHPNGELRGQIVAAEEMKTSSH
jgi:hypothetical protein